ncbi:hypothetical protein GCM10011415_39870 [Salipiger pallidus]|uniref:Uncharacterized protein n=1 Tax=Salipiger pallidus TaxID=1775170 RepID=A0A8J2ZNB3_9RHOB|nr:hypothetical protein [Salipiger pallidus]GGG85604.1 hypothetical protein GCM10011415_39870 [Salipiger pallidus]
MPHELSNVLVLPHVLQFNAPEAHVIYAQIEADAFPERPTIAGTEAPCEMLISLPQMPVRNLKMPCRVRVVGLPGEAPWGMAGDTML